MISWVWIPVFLLIGIGVGIFLLALVSAGREKEKDFFGKDWKQMRQILNTMCNVEDRLSLEGDEKESFDTAILCISHIMNRLRWKK